MELDGTKLSLMNLLVMPQEKLERNYFMFTKHGSESPLNAGRSKKLIDSIYFATLKRTEVQVGEEVYQIMGFNTIPHEIMEAYLQEM